MGFKLGNVNNKASLIFKNEYYELSKISNGELTNDMSDVLHSIDTIENLYSKIEELNPLSTI